MSCRGAEDNAGLPFIDRLATSAPFIGSDESPSSAVIVAFQLWHGVQEKVMHSAHIGGVHFVHAEARAEHNLAAHMTVGINGMIKDATTL